MALATGRFAAPALVEYGQALLRAAGMQADKARTVAELLVLTDMMGRRTHGLAMVSNYLADIAKGGMRLSGEPTVVKDRGATLVWDADYLPGLWVVKSAIELAIERIAQHGVVSVAIRKTHHIGCLAALSKQAADKGFIAIIANSDPAGKRVAPFGGTEALFTPNPLAIAYPGKQNPVLVDMCASITTTSMTREKHARGELFEHPWLLDAHGKPTCDPAVLEHSEPRGSLQLLGGQEYGHKGFGLALGIEALSQGLSGHGRLEAPKRWGGNVFLQLLDPEFFAGAQAFEDQTDYLAQQCRANKPIHHDQAVRLPGDQAARSIAHAKENGISFDDRVWQDLQTWAAKLGVTYSD